MNGYEVNRTNLYEAIAEQMQQMIIDDVFKRDERLPSEQQLAQNFGVSRNIIREAFKILKERGLIEVRTGNGAYVRKPNSSQLRDVVKRFMNIGDVTYEQVYEMRFALEVVACGLAAERSTEEEITELEEILSHMKENIDSVDHWVKLDFEFHCLIAKMTKNLLFYSFIKSIAGTLITIFKTGYADTGACLKGIENHMNITEAIRKHDKDLAETCMRNHLQQSRKNVLTAKDENGITFYGKPGSASEMNKA